MEFLSPAPSLPTLSCALPRLLTLNHDSQSACKHITLHLSTLTRILRPRRGPDRASEFIN